MTLFYAAKSKLAVLGAILLTIGPASSALAKTALDECWEKSESRVDVGACLQGLKANSDAGLEASFQSALKSLTELDEATGRPLAVRALERAQLAFELFRNLECNVQELQAGSGSGSGDFYLGCWIDQTRSRIEALNKLAGQNPPASLVGTSWVAEEIEAQAVLGDPQSTLTFGDDDQVSGNAACNGYFGSVTISGNSLEFGPLGSTRMACPGAIDDQETRFLDALSKATAFSFVGGLLVLADDSGTALVRLARNE